MEVDWEDWWKKKEQYYPSKEERIEEDMPLLEGIFKKNNVSKILDVGCGNGKRDTSYFARKGFTVYGFDVSPSAIEEAKERLKKEDLYADLRVWDMAQRFPYDDNFFDAVISRRAFHHFNIETIRKVVGEIERVTNKNGYIYAKVPAYEKILRMVKEGGNFKETESGTYEALDTIEKGIPHHYFKKEELSELFRNYLIEHIYVSDEHYCLIGRKK